MKNTLAKPALPQNLASWIVLPMLLLVGYILLLDNGLVLSASDAEYVHEITHDARHALGVPCH